MTRRALARVRLTGEEPQLPSTFRVAAAGQASIAAAGLAAAEIWKLRSGEAQDVTVDMRHAVVECRSERYLRVDDKPPPPAWDAIAGVYKTGDGRFVRCHTNFPHHRDAVCQVLACKPEREAVQSALMRWKGEDFETAAYAAGGVVALMRSHDGMVGAAAGARARASCRWSSIEKIGEAPPKPIAEGDRPLVRPACARSVARDRRPRRGPHARRARRRCAAGVRARAPGDPWLTIDTGRGKLASFIELKTDEGETQLRALLAEADIFSQGYRPRSLATLGFGPEDAAKINPGIV